MTEWSHVTRDIRLYNVIGKAVLFKSLKIVT